MKTKKAMKTERPLSLNDILVRPVSKVLDRYEIPTDYATYTPTAIKMEESKMASEFRKLNKLHQEAQEAMMSELANVLV